jgi:hypothetical protein
LSETNASARGINIEDNIAILLRAEAQNHRIIRPDQNWPATRNVYAELCLLDAWGSANPARIVE